ncbi:pyridoxamine 5'-phosphate oxidase family protein [Paraflavitalea soli]|uniref:pyridoxamine 5'-phosphate oxidase family protein n=1 Tax=Paraflavitalea soli TaxID=2315862 RepID=UPI0021D00B71|nr:pyridoxamine 5'-phosphate oxidase family protein [Paraflavitalea soli]
MSYAYDGTYTCCRADEGMKVAMMRSNPEICFEVDHFSNRTNWESVIAWGTYEELTEVEASKQALQKLVDRVLPLISSETVHLSPQWPFPAQDLKEIKGIVFRIRVKRRPAAMRTIEVQDPPKPNPHPSIPSKQTCILLYAVPVF